MLSLRYCTQHSIPLQRFSLNFQEFTEPFFLHPLYSSPAISRRLRCSFKLNNQNEQHVILPGVEEAMVSYMFGRKKATQVVHSVWKHIVQKGDTVVDATCGNGHDTLEMLRMVADETGRGRVYGMDVQKDALQSTNHLLDKSLSSNEKELVKLIPMCHSKMEEVVPEDTSVRLVAFNLGYLPGGDKAVTTRPETTLPALKAAERILGSGGLISLVVYVGHPGGREELQTVEDFASGLSAEDWVCSKFQMLNRPLAPVPVFLFKR